jgi:arsenate reductase
VNEPFDLVITVCDEANESCPYLPNAKERRHWSFPDPSAVRGDDETRFAAFRDVRDAVRDRIERELLVVRAG